MKIAILFDNLGPYHKARLRAVAGKCDVLALEFGTTSSEYAWQNEPLHGMRHAVCNPHGASKNLALPAFRSRIAEILGDFGPDVVAVPGWGKTGAFLAYQWCMDKRCPAIVMSESTVWDERRVGWKEYIKRRIVSRASSALVGGSPHQEYIEQLGMPPSHVFQGYDTVDNAYFAKKSQDFKAQDARVEHKDSVASSSFQLSAFQFSAFTPKYFLASNRFIAKKNLFRLIEAYARYVKSFQCSVFSVQSEEGKDRSPTSTINNPQSSIVNQSPPWHLCLLGDGELKPALIAKCHELGLKVIEKAPWDFDQGPRTTDATKSIDSSSPSPDSRLLHPVSSSPSPPRPLTPSPPPTVPPGTVFFPGFRQIDELPRFYAHAGVFVHASTTEQWGLVVNEAMACGLPVIVSNRVGCARDLVAEGRNGFTFDPLDVAQLAGLLERMASMPEQERDGMGEAGRDIIANWGPDRFASGLMAAAQKAIGVGSKRASLAERMLLRALAAR